MDRDLPRLPGAEEVSVGESVYLYDRAGNPVPVRVTYPEDRVTHFRPFMDFFRISVLNTVLCILAIFYGYPRMLLRSFSRK